MTIEHTLSHKARLRKHICNNTVQCQTFWFGNWTSEISHFGEIKVVSKRDSVPAGDFQDLMLAVAVESSPLDFTPWAG